MKEGDKVYCIKNFELENLTLFSINHSYYIHTIRENDRIFLNTNEGEEDFYGFSNIKKYENWEFFNEYFITEKQYRKYKLQKLNERR